MRKGHDIIGLLVIGQSDAANLGKVRDLVFDADASQCIGLVMQEGGMFSEAQVVPWEEIATIGPNAVMVRSAASKIRADDAPQIKAVIEQENRLSGTRVVTEEGNELGSVGDVYLDEETGRVLGDEVSGGLVADSVSGKRYVPAEVGTRVGRDVLFVPAHVEGMLESQAQSEPGGLKGALGAAKDKVTDTYASVASASVDKQKDFVEGKVAGSDVFLPAGAASTTTPTLDPAAVAAPGRTFADPEPATILDPMGERASVRADILENEGLVSAPGMAFSDPEPATILDPMGTHAAAESAATLPPPAPSSAATPAHGPLLVARGETITRDHADRAEQAGILHQLLVSIGGGALSSARDSVTGQASATGAGMQERAEDAAIGKQAGREVRLLDGSLLVAPGMLITQTMMDTARREGKERELIAAAGVGSAQQGAATVGEHASNLLGTAREKMSGLVGAGQEKKADFDNAQEQKKINHALGRPSTRVILSQGDAVILNVGDIITNKAVAVARSEGVLDVLLASVYDEEPEITPEMMRATQPGEAALPTQAQPTTAPITATVTPEQPAQSTPSQGQAGASS